MANLKDLLVNGVTRFIGKVYAPTPETGDNSTQVATTAFVMENAGASGYHPTLFDFKYSDKLLNDIQWLRADTFSWQDSSVYVAAYNKLVEEYNNSASTTVTEGSITFKRTPNGYKIALTDQETAILNKYNSNGIAWYYILDKANKRFKLPRTKFGFEGLRTSVGDDIEAGLPNITGNIGLVGNTNGVSVPAATNGAFASSSSGGGAYGGGDGRGNDEQATISYNASRSSSIYGNSNTVQPPATQMYLYFYVGQFTQTATEQTAGLNSELFNNKLDLNANNLNTAGKSLISGLGMPSGQYIDLTPGASGSTYTAPANGWFYFTKWAANNYNGYISLGNLNSSIAAEWRNTIGLGRVYIPAKKGDTVVTEYDAQGNTEVLRFIYAEGAKNG